MRFFHAVPPQVDRPAPARGIDVQAISRAIGFDISSGRKPRPNSRLLYAFDWQKAWKGQHPTLHTDITVQAAAWHGRITDLQVLAPWSKPWREPESYATDWKDSARTLMEKLTYGLVFLFSAFMAARNLRAGRGDRRGAWRLSVACFILMGAHLVVLGALGGRHLHDPDLPRERCGLVHLGGHHLAALHRARTGRARALAAFHLDLEPRAGRPLAGCASGRARPLWGAARSDFRGLLSRLPVARDFAGVPLLDGEDVGVQRTPLYGRCPGQGAGRRGVRADRGVRDLLFPHGFPERLDRFHSGRGALHIGGKRTWQGNMLDFLLFLVIFTLLAFVLLRLGLVSTIVAIFFVNFLLPTPGAQGLTKPYESAVITYPALVLAIVIWAFWRTSGRQLMTVNGSETGLLARRPGLPLLTEGRCCTLVSVTEG